MVNGPPDPVTGRRRQFTRTVSAPNRTVALQQLAEFGAEVRRGASGSPTSLTLREACDRWFDHANGGLSPNTAGEFNASLERYVLPLALAGKQLGRVKAQDLDALYSHLLARGGKGGRPLSPSTVRKVHAVLSLVFAQAVRWDWIARSPASDATPPSVPGRQPSAPDAAAVRTLMAAAASEADPSWFVYLRMAATTGRRRGELCGLHWSEVDLDRGRAVIFWVVKLGRNAKPVLVPYPKSARGKGTIGLDPGTVEAMRRLRRWQEERAAFFDTKLVDRALVFSNEIDGSQPWHPAVVTHRFGRLRKRAGTPGVRLHDLRHFAASELLAEGFGVSTVAGRLGNSPAVLLGTYAHLVGGHDDDQAGHLGALLDDDPSGEDDG